MKRKLLFFVALTVCMAVPSFGQQWLFYDASVLPSATAGQSLDLSALSQNSPGPNFEEVILADPDISGNSLLRYVSADASSTKMYLFQFEDAVGTPWTGADLTLVARIKGLDDWQALGLDRIFDLQYRVASAGFRDELRMHYDDNSVELDRSGGITFQTGMDLTDWHVYRIAIFGDSSVVYLDENPVPVLIGVSTATTTDNYLKIGDGSGDAIGGLVDWVALDTTGAYSPTLSPLDSVIFTGVFTPPPPPPTPVTPSWMIYTADLLPTQTASEPFNLSTLSQSSPGPNFEEALVGDPVIPGNSLLRFVEPDSFGSRMYRFDFLEAPGTKWKGVDFTLIARMKGLDNWQELGLERLFDLQYRHGNVNARDELRINYSDNSIDLERSNVTPVVTGIDVTDWHIYRIAVFGDSSVVYVDEDPNPVLIGVSTSGTTDTYFKMGDGSGAAVGGLVDWVALDTTGAYSPLQTALDSTLFSGIGVPPTLADVVFITRQDWKDDSGSYGDSLFVAALHNAGYNVILPPYADFSTVDSADAEILKAADLVVLGRGISSGDFAAADDSIWEQLENPVILMSNYVARANRLRWFASNETPYGVRFGTLQATVETPDDTVFTGVDVSSGLIDYAEDEISMIAVDPATINGKVLLSLANGPLAYIVDTNNGAVTDSVELSAYDGNVLMARFAPGDSMFLGGPVGGNAAAVPAGWRTFFTTGDDHEFDTLQQRRLYNFYVFPDAMKQVFLNEVDYLLRGPVKDTSSNISIDREKWLGFAAKAYPNPFQHEVTIQLELEVSGSAQVELLSVEGRLIQRIPLGHLGAGQHHVSIAGEALPPGLYFFRVEVNGRSANGILQKQ